MTVEIQKDSHKLLSESRCGWLRLKEFRFVKRRIYKNRQGEVVQEVPFTEHVILISCRKQALWLRPLELRDLKELLEDAEEEPPAPKAEGQQELEGFAVAEGGGEDD